MILGTWNTAVAHWRIAYEPSVDSAGHENGPMSPQVNVRLSAMFIHAPHVLMSPPSCSQEALAKVDVFARDLYHSLLSRNLSQIVDVIFVSDHGMSDTSEVELVYLDGDDILGTFIPFPRKSCSTMDGRPVDIFISIGETWNNVTHHDGWPLYGLRFSEETDQRVALEKLVRASNEPQFNGKFQVYFTDSYTGGMHLRHDPSWPENYELFLYRVP